MHWGLLSPWNTRQSFSRKQRAGRRPGTVVGSGSSAATALERLAPPALALKRGDDQGQFFTRKPVRLGSNGISQPATAEIRILTNMHGDTLRNPMFYY